MKIIGTLDTKDDGDILKDVLDHLPKFDAIFAYNDGSRDDTEVILKNHRIISKYVNRDDFPSEIVGAVPQHRRHHLLKMVMDEFHTYNTEKIWVIRLEADRYFMNTTPWDMCHRADFHGLEGVAGVMVDCRIGPDEDWNKLDSYPNWHLPLPVIQNWGRIDDVHPVVAFRVLDGVKHSTTKPRPWPIIWGPTNYLENDYVTEDMAFFAHHGRRGPKYWSWAYRTGSRPKSKKFPEYWNLASAATAYATVDDLPFRPRKHLHRLVSAPLSYDLDRTTYYQNVHNDIANLCCIWNSIPPRKLKS